MKGTGFAGHRLLVSVGQTGLPAAGDSAGGHLPPPPWRADEGHGQQRPQPRGLGILARRIGGSRASGPPPPGLHARRRFWDCEPPRSPSLGNDSCRFFEQLHRWLMEVSQHPTA